MITAKNYYAKVSSGEISKSKLPDTLQKGFDFMDKVTLKGDSWSAYETSDTIKKTIDLYLEKLNDFEKTLSPKKEVEKQRAVIPKKTIPNLVEFERKEKKMMRHEITHQKGTKTEKVEQISSELKFIRRFTNMSEKKKDRNQIRLFLSALQKAIKEKRISKMSKFANEIMEIQNTLIKFHAQFKTVNQKLEFEISKKDLAKYLMIIGKQVEFMSVKFIKSYINLQGKVINTKQAKSLHNKIANAINNGKLTKQDKYFNEVESVRKQLKSFAQKNPRSGILQIETRELNGLNGILSDCGCACEADLNGMARVPDNTIMNSMDIVKLNFEKLGLTGKWLQLIGNPSKDFTAMIYGKPKMGKSYLAVDFAGYLARNHGRVLYVAKEEGIDDTLQEKLDDKNVACAELDVSNYLPEQMDQYDFVFLDSVTKLGLSPKDLNDLKRRYPEKAFIFIFQTTKHGNFKGNNEFQHDVDVVIEIPVKGKAVQYGRFNQGGSMNIFGEKEATESF